MGWELMSRWWCYECEAGGADPDLHPACWWCGRPAKVEARVQGGPPAAVPAGWPR